MPCKTISHSFFYLADHGVQDSALGTYIEYLPQGRFPCHKTKLNFDDMKLKEMGDIIKAKINEINGLAE